MNPTTTQTINGQNVQIPNQYLNAPIVQSALSTASAVPSNTSTVVKAGNIGTTPLNLPQPSTPINVNPSVSAPTGATTDANGNAVTTPATETPASPYQEQLKKLGLLGDTLGTRAQVTTDLQNQMQLAQKTETATKDYNAFNQAKLDLQQQIDNIYKQPITREQANQQVQELQRTGNANLANLAVISQASQGLLSAAQQTIKDKIEAQFQPVQDQIDFYTKLAQLNQNDLSESDKLKLQAAQEQKKTDMALVQKTVSDLSENLLNNNAPANVYGSLDRVVSDFSSGKITAQEAQTKLLQSVGHYGGDTLGQQYKQQQLINLKNQNTTVALQQQKLRDEIANNKPITGDYGSVINGVVGLLGAQKGAAVKETLASSLAGGDYVTSYATIANSVEDSLTGSNKTKFADTRTDIGVMSGMRDAIKAYADAGGNMGYLKGTADDIAKRFGQLATDPKFASLGTQLQREFQSYRLSMTGAAFSPQESKEYEAVNPTTGKSLDLNLAVIDGALSQLTNRVTSTVNQRIPDAQKIYDLASGKAPQSTPAPITSATTKINGLTATLPTGSITFPNQAALDQFKKDHNL